MSYTIAGYGTDSSFCLCEKCIEKEVTPVELMVMFKNVSSWRTKITEWPVRDEDGWYVRDDDQNIVMEERDERYDREKHIPLTEDGKEWRAVWDDGSDDGYGISCDACGHGIVEPYKVQCRECGCDVASADEAFDVEREFNSDEIYCPGCQEKNVDTVTEQVVEKVRWAIYQIRFKDGNSLPMEDVLNHLEDVGVMAYSPWPIALDLRAYEEVREVQKIVDETIDEWYYDLRKTEELKAFIESL